MTEFAAAPPDTLRIDTRAQSPVIEPAADAALFDARVQVDRYAITPKEAASQP